MQVNLSLFIWKESELIISCHQGKKVILLLSLYHSNVWFNQSRLTFLFKAHNVFAKKLEPGLHSSEAIHWKLIHNCRVYAVELRVNKFAGRALLLILWCKALLFWLAEEDTVATLPMVTVSPYCTFSHSFVEFQFYFYFNFL